eukprot:4002989-Amphidinium_carterae.1
MIHVPEQAERGSDCVFLLRLAEALVQLHSGLVGLWPMFRRSYLDDLAEEKTDASYSLPEAQQRCHALRSSDCFAISHPVPNLRLLGESLNQLVPICSTATHKRTMARGLAYETLGFMWDGVQ